MRSGVKGTKRQRNGVSSVPREGVESATLRHGEEIIALAPGDPLRYALGLSLDELYSLQRTLGPVLERRPYVKRVLEAIIGQKEQEIDRHRAREGREGR